MIRKINITIDPALHEQAKVHAKTVHCTSLSGLITKLIVDDLIKSGDLRRPTTGTEAAILLRESTRAALGRAGSHAAALALLNPRQLQTLPGPQLVA